MEAESREVRIGDYELVRKLREGGMGKVYEAEDRQLRRRVALKTLSAKALRDPDAVRRLAEEGHLAGRLNHPNIVSVHAFGVADGRAYLVLDYLEGVSLEARIESAPMLPSRIGETLLPILSAVRACHDAGILHRDLKPENIFLAKRGDFEVPMLIDFGIAWDVDPTQRDGPLGAGTPDYMAPEQLEGETGGPGADQYALGVVLYEMATGHLPRNAEDDAERLALVAKHGFVPPRHHVPNLDETLETVITRALSKSRSDRYRSITEMMRALLPIAPSHVQPVYAREVDAAERADSDGLDSEESGSIPTLDARMVRAALRDSFKAPALELPKGPSRMPAAACLGVGVGVGLLLYHLLFA